MSAQVNSWHCVDGMAFASIDPDSAEEQTIASIIPAAKESARKSKSVTCKKTTPSILPFAAGIFHITASVLTLSVFFWHLTPAAAKLPGAKAFGWFFKFLTFWGWTTQTIQFLLCVVHLCTPKTAKFWRSFTRFIDDFSCMAFTVSILITVQFWILHLVTGGLVERSQDRPPWLGFSVHVLNACMSVADVLLSNPRSFSPRAHTMLLGYTTLYAAFLAVCRHKNGKYPYPFMNKMHPAAAFLFMLCLSMTVLHLINIVGAALSAASSKALSKPDMILAEPLKKNGKTKATAKRNGRQRGPVLRNGKNGNKQN